MKQIKSILEKLTRDHEQLRDAVQGTSPPPNEATKSIGQSAESRADYKKAKDSRSNHAAMHVDVQGSALDRVHSAVQKNIARQERIRATGRKWIPSPRRQIYIGNINGTSPRPNEAAKPIGQSAESLADYKKAKDSRSNHADMHVDVQGSALDRVHSAV